MTEPNTEMFTKELHVSLVLFISSVLQPFKLNTTGSVNLLNTVLHTQTQNLCVKTALYMNIFHVPKSLRVVVHKELCTQHLLTKGPKVKETQPI